jgi:hydroxyacylglutathione hydrolase
VFPGHVAGSLCGKSMSSKASTTIGFERRFNPALAHTALDEFVAESAAVGAPKPANAGRIVALNAGALVGAPAAAEELPAAPPGAQLLDARPVEDFLAGHVRGALSVPVTGTSFSTKAGFVLDAERPLVVAVRDEAEAASALRGLRSVGFLEVGGYVVGGGSETMEPVRIDELESLLENGAELIDVREKDERDDGYIAGSRNVPYRMLALADGEVPSDRPVVTICESGARAAIAASLLAARGVDARPVMDGGVTEWVERGGAAVSFRRCG